ncbi:hypothetical protein H4P12_14800 [Paracoccus sp. 11-3]|uniref:Anti-sigma factor n=1 Tax=Paracoccus amoyensis TaxID=2760093 RepID=A0A926JC96_9RHOB|nr:hypothetical protein [Paracoccus amoyensis]MBC9247946.1 hypothetical protein [Paracoccus amoyensis]
MQIDDQTLMALADGELDAATAAKVTATVNADPALQARLRMFTETRTRLQADIPAPQPTAKDADLAAMIRATQAASDTAAKAPPPPAQPANINRRPLMAIAAALALAVVGLGWWQNGEPAQSGFGAGQLAALESLPSGQTQRLEDGRDLTMVASYQNGDGEFCREYETFGEAAQIVVACRGSDGWAERFAVSIQEEVGYVPATGEIAELDQFLNQSGMGQPLSPEEEAAALAE